MLNFVYVYKGFYMLTYRTFFAAYTGSMPEEVIHAAFGKKAPVAG